MIELNDQLVADMLAVESDALADIMRRLRQSRAPNEECKVIATLTAQMAGYLAHAMSETSPGEIYTPEATIAWLVDLMNEHLRQKQGATS